MLLRALSGASLAYLAVVALGLPAIAALRRICRERIDTASAALAVLHSSKSGTPSMGGLIIVAGWLAGVAICGDLANRNVQIAMLATFAFVILGATDDLIKARGRKRGLSARSKLAVQLVIGFAAATAIGLQRQPPGGDRIEWVLFVPLAAIFIAGMSNAVNVSDGLDGLAAGCGALVATALAVAAAIGSKSVGDEQAGQIGLMAGALAGALAGFLRFNRHPARLFMGDTGSLPVGGLLALLALTLDRGWLLLILGGVFLAELASVVVQVAWFRRTGQRVFRCAPLHHHFEFLGWPETAIVRRFWLASAVLALAGVLATIAQAGG
ncbi:MAG TPA: phospho-N-acetylmuramoyl-pentapeptide-transferase [Pirellulales bacterium]|jgi:phospho-N-acetylmuramoyl-pentapeptide-transferase|nr:phospho-N-acetylmuramoyl-pentapeptide-transferase [Pirellulales bacterium]